jgi:2-haloacid dehalogenase
MSAKRRTPAIVFDLGKVLIDWDPRHLYRKLFDGDEVRMERFLAEVCTQEWNERQDAGRPFAEAVEELLARHPEHEAFIRAFHERWPETVAGAIEGTVEVLADLRAAGYQLGALSNWSAETFRLVRSRFEFLEWFDAIVLSGEVRILKPDPRIFAVLLERLGRRADECVFVDDSAANVEGARRLGFDTIRFATPEALRAELERRGVLAGAR